MSVDLAAMARARSPRYNSVAIALHWVIALAILGMIGLGWFMGDLANGHPLKEQLYQLHKSIGITILTLTLARIGWRVMNPPPPLPTGMADWETKLSHAVHIGFYGLMIAMPLTGWLYVSTAYQFDVATVLFGAVSWPDLPFVGFLANEAGHGAVENIHSKLAWVAIALLALHVGGAVKHDILDDEGVLKRMIPGLLGKTEAPARPARGFLPAFGGALAVSVLIALVPALGGGGGGAQAGPVAPLDQANWQVAADRSKITFSGTHEGKPFEGRFEDWSASIAFDPDRLDQSEVTVSITTGSAVTGTKLYTDTLRQREWLNVSDHPVAEVRLDQFVQTDSGYRAQATIRLKDAEITVPFDFSLEIEGETARMTGAARLTRSALDLGQSSDPGADWVGEEVAVDVELEAVRSDAG